MIDALGREIDHLRISLTNKCNLDCFYCHQEGNHFIGPEMNTDAVKKRLAEAREIGLKTIKFTGGEPLLRPDICEIIAYAKKLGFSDIGMTSNGTLLPKLAKNLKSAGLERVNIGCDTITDSLPKKTDVRIIKAAKGLKVKLNMVVLQGINDHEIWDMVEFAKLNRVNLQLIELVQINDVYEKYFLSLAQIEKELAAKAQKSDHRDMQNRNRFYFKDMYVETVRPSRAFCESCNKIRITADGMIRKCLMQNEMSDSFIDAIKGRDTYGYG